jgi:hypothetical protein
MLFDDLQPETVSPYWGEDDPSQGFSPSEPEPAALSTTMSPP